MHVDNDARYLRFAAAVGLTAAAVGTVAFLVGRRTAARTRSLEGLTDPAEVDNVSHDDRRGTAADRGRTPAFALDVDQLRSRPEFEPAVEYLTFIQSKRGTDSHLLFVRFEDLDAIAALEGDSVPDFLERLDHLGVVVSNN